jgi:hypothetical protein
MKEMILALAVALFVPFGGEDHAEGIAEAVDVQAKNTRAASKTYHLIVSFRIFSTWRRSRVVTIKTKDKV